MEEKPNYYAVIPANVRYNKKLSANQKLLYGEITSLCNKTGECWATNDYFAKLYGVSKVSISLWIKNLVNEEYITSEIVKGSNKEILKRSLRILNDPLKENLNTPIKENLKENNTSNNNTSIIIKKNITENEFSELFDEFWDEYPKRRVDKAKCKTKFLKLDLEIQKKIIEDVKNRKENDEKWVKGFVPMTSTYLNNQKWEDDLEVKEKLKVYYLDELK